MTLHLDLSGEWVTAVEMNRRTQTREQLSRAYVETGQQQKRLRSLKDLLRGIRSVAQGAISSPALNLHNRAMRLLNPAGSSRVVRLDNKIGPQGRLLNKARLIRQVKVRMAACRRAIRESKGITQSIIQRHRYLFVSDEPPMCSSGPRHRMLEYR